MDKTINLNLKLLKYNQAQKEVLINEAISLLDSMVQRTVIDITEALPSSAEDGDVYIYYDNSIAIYLNGWRFLSPKDGWVFWVRNRRCNYIFFENKWVLQQEGVKVIEGVENECVLDCNQFSRYRIFLDRDTSFTIKRPNFSDSTVEMNVLLCGKDNAKLSWPDEIKWNGTGGLKKIDKNSHLFLKFYLFDDVIVGQNTTC